MTSWVRNLPGTVIEGGGSRKSTSGIRLDFKIYAGRFMYFTYWGSKYWRFRFRIYSFTQNTAGHSWVFVEKSMVVYGNCINCVDDEIGRLKWTPNGWGKRVAVWGLFAGRKQKQWIGVKERESKTTEEVKRWINVPWKKKTQFRKYLAVNWRGEILKFNSDKVIKICKKSWKFSDFFINPLDQHLSLDQDLPCFSQTGCRVHGGGEFRR